MAGDLFLSFFNKIDCYNFDHKQIDENQTMVLIHLK